MRAMPALPGRAVVAALERAGFEVVRTKGSHHFLRHRDDPGRQTVVPVHRNDLPPGTLRGMRGKRASTEPGFLIFSERLCQHLLRRFRGFDRGQLAELEE
jgi:predicted RNA binding protein YcfA (HicA-like mRNA interferase family)